ncbi:hypothetical protein C810_01522 [Lachnospiraceae bacterium A2]|nr:hypothetical protein C810_01522 [Lachnospiraceae bacterium A2]
MSDVLGYNNFCSACKGSNEENGELVCRDKNGKFYSLPVNQVLMAPCLKMKDKKERENHG